MNKAAVIRDLQDAFWAEAERLLLHHTNPWELDEALEGFGYQSGPCAAQDLFGLDQVLARRTAPAAPVLPRMVAEGRLGKVTGVGYYRYPGGGGAVIDPLIEDLIREEAWLGKIERSEMVPERIVSEMNAALVTVCRALPVGLDWGAVLGKAVDFPTDRYGELGF